MGILTVNKELCCKDEKCGAVCPLNLIQFEEDYPVETADAEQLCMDCGHCVAVCPTAALTQRLHKPEEALPFSRDMALSAEQMEQFLRQRRSIRCFKEQAVPRETLKKLIELARYGNTGHNSQTLKWLVIQGQEKIKPLSTMVIDWMKYMIKEQPGMASHLMLDKFVANWEAGKDTVSWQAPALLLVYSDAQDFYGPISTPIALSYMELAAPTLGLGTCWNGYMGLTASQWPAFMPALDLPEGSVVHGIMMVGYPEFEYPRMPTRNEPPIIWR